MDTSCKRASSRNRHIAKDDIKQQKLSVLRFGVGSGTLSSPLSKLSPLTQRIHDMNDLPDMHDNFLCENDAPTEMSNLLRISDLSLRFGVGLCCLLSRIDRARAHLCLW